MKLSASPAQSKQAFTLIELLIVIALLGALAIGLLAAIDPVEQIRKGRDTTVRNTAANWFNGQLRYYAVKGQFTWGTATSFTARGVSVMGSDTTELINAGELKTNFSAAAGTANLAKILVTTTAAAQNLQVCFLPESKGFQEDPITIFGSDGIQTTGCKSQTSSGGNNCYMCLQ